MVKKQAKPSPDNSYLMWIKLWVSPEPLPVKCTAQGLGLPRKSHSRSQIEHKPQFRQETSISFGRVHMDAFPMSPKELSKSESIINAWIAKSG